MMDQSNPHDAPRRRLGRGISALLGGSAPAHEVVETSDASELRHLATAMISRNPYQPRKDFETESLGELAASVKEHGILQPLLVREYQGGFQLIAGERRLLAAQKAGLETVPCRVVDVIDKTACEFALEENLKRKDLSDLEKAAAFREYINHFECTVEELARQLSMSRSAVSNLMRLLDLCEPVKNALQAGKITSGHARALLSLDEAGQVALCGRIQAESLNVRQTEQVVKESQGRAEQEQQQNAEIEAVDSHDGEAPDTLPISAHSEGGMTNHLRDLQDQLRNALGTSVEIKLKTKDSGQIVILFANNDEFIRITGQLRERAAA